MQYQEHDVLLLAAAWGWTVSMEACTAHARLVREWLKAALPVCAGASAYLGTLFTAAPLPVLQAAIQHAFSSSTQTPDQLPPAGGAATSHGRLQSSVGSVNDASSVHLTAAGPGSRAAGSWHELDGGPDSEWQLLDDAAAACTAGSRSSAEDAVIVIEGFGCMSGQGRAIVRDLSLRLRPGERLLLVGASGVGKSTLLRALRGLWPYCAAWVSMPPEVCLSLPCLIRGQGTAGFSGRRLRPRVSAGDVCGSATARRARLHAERAADLPIHQAGAPRAAVGPAA